MRETRDVVEKDQDHGGARALAVITASLLVPFPLNALLFVICHELEQWSSVSLYLDFLPVFTSIGVGFYFLARRFRRYAVAIAIVYIPVMFVALVFFGLILAGSLYDNYL